MPTLAETQKFFRNAVVGDDMAGIRSLIVGGRDASKRLEVHRRNYETSLVTALLGKFPATVWLAGTPFVTEAARHFVCEHPPHAPCIAEYGERFPGFLSACPGAERVPYLREFAELEWHVGHIAVAVDQPPVSLQEFSAINDEALLNMVLALQPGVRYLHMSWPIDELMKLYLTETAADSFEFSPADAWIQARGARGEFHMDRLDASEFIFRKSISEGQAIVGAAERALDADPAFDPGRALVRVVAEGLVTAIMSGSEGDK